MKVLVTGGGGYVGSVLCRQLLERGYAVRAMDNFHKGWCDSLIPLCSDVNFEFQEGDVTSANDVKRAYEGVDAVVHLAAIVGFPQCAKQPKLSEIVNIGGTEMMLQHRPNNISFVFASTGSVYGKVVGMCTEDSPLNAVSLYGKTKIDAENLVSKEPNTVSYRFSTGFGLSPNMRVNLLVNDLVYKALNDKSLTLFEPYARRTFIHVKDMARAFIFGVENCCNLGYNIFNCGDDHLNCTKDNLAQIISQKTGCIINYADNRSDADQRDYAVSFKRLNSVGFKCNYTLQEGIEELVKATPLVKIRHQYD